MYIVSQDIIASTKPNTPSDLSHFILIYIALMNAVITSSNRASLVFQHFCIVSNILEFQMINLK